ncbi:MAG: hypothetical protein VYE73_04015, partial [Acidobacteriota bacterium]|nr:hypothetical protein [Acidobacteriota bacterium]
VLTLPEVDSPDVEVMAMEVDVRAPTPSEGPSESFRYARAGHREIVATSDEVALTMSLDRADAHHGELVVGHLRDRTRSTGLADVTVHISDERKTLASTLTNQLGDFHIEVPTGEGTLLTVMLEPGRQIRIRLA